MLGEKLYPLINTTNGPRGGFVFNWTANTFSLEGRVGSHGSYTSSPSSLGLWSAGEPNTISVAFHRIGYVTMTAGVISVQPITVSASNKTQVQLQKFDDGFLKNEILPSDELLRENLFQPLK